MSNSSARSAVLFMTHKWNFEIQRRFDAIQLDEHYDKWALIDRTGLNQPISADVVTASKIWEVRFDQLMDIGYRPIAETVIPGSNHFGVLEFANANPGYHWIWAVEFDVIYTGDWQTLFDSFPTNVDFLSTQIRTHEDDPNWSFWQSLIAPDQLGQSDLQLLASFNPLYRLSKPAAHMLRNAYRLGWRGHHEVSMPTLIQHAGYRIEDIGGTERFTPSTRLGKLYSRQSYRWRPCITLAELADAPPNRLFHPLKTETQILRCSGERESSQ